MAAAVTMAILIAATSVARAERPSATLSSHRNLSLPLCEDVVKVGKGEDAKTRRLGLLYFALADLTDLNGGSCFCGLQEEQVMIDKEDWTESVWYQCLLAAVTYENTHANWVEQPRFKDCILNGTRHEPEGPAGQVIELFLTRAKEMLLCQEMRLHAVVGGWTAAEVTSGSSMIGERSISSRAKRQLAESRGSSLIAETSISSRAERQSADGGGPSLPAGASSALSLARRRARAAAARLSGQAAREARGKGEAEAS